MDYSDLLDSISYYDGKYVEISGKYVFELEKSALYDSRLFADNSPSNTIWIKFTELNQSCSLRLEGTNEKLLDDSHDLSVIYDKEIVLRGRIDITYNGHLSQYKGSLVDIRMLKFK